MPKIKILFVLDSLQAGGAQRVVLTLLRCIDRELFVPLLTLATPGKDNLPGVPPDVLVNQCQRQRVRYAILPTVDFIRKTKPDLVFSTLTHVNITLLLSSLLPQVRFSLVMRSSNYPSLNIPNTPFVGRLIAHWTYKRARKVVASTQMMCQDLQRLYNIPSHRIQVIPNPVDIETIERLSKEQVDHPWFCGRSAQRIPIIVAVGRLDPRKGFRFLLRAVSKVRKHVTVRLVILGEGQEELQLKSLAERLGITECVALLGFQENPYKYMAKADVFVLSSLTEGFPNVLVEAMACGVPVVSADCPSGPSEIITPGVDGLLVPPADPETLAEAILRVLKDKELGNKLAKAGRERVMDFEVSRIVSEYEELFRSVAME